MTLPTVSLNKVAADHAKTAQSLLDCVEPLSPDSVKIGFVSANLFAAWATREINSLQRQVAETLSDMAYNYGDEVARQFGSHAIEADIVLAGFMHGKPRACMIATHDRHGTVPFEADEIQSVFLTPSDEKLRERFANLNSRFDEKRAVQLVHKQRSIPPKIFRKSAVSIGTPIQSVVGGGVQLTTIHADRIETRILKRWKRDEVNSRLVA